MSRRRPPGDGKQPPPVELPHPTFRLLVSYVVSATEIQTVVRATDATYPPLTVYALEYTGDTPPSDPVVIATGQQQGGLYNVRGDETKDRATFVFSELTPEQPIRVKFLARNAMDMRVAKVEGPFTPTSFSNTKSLRFDKMFKVHGTIPPTYILEGAFTVGLHYQFAADPDLDVLLTNEMLFFHLGWSFTDAEFGLRRTGDGYELFLRVRILDNSLSEVVAKWPTTTMKTWLFDWFHVGAAFDGEYGYLYWNGLQIAKSKMGQRAPRVQYEVLVGGKWDAVNGESVSYADGYIDELVMFETFLDETAMIQLCNNHTSLRLNDHPNFDDLVCWFRFEDSEVDEISGFQLIGDKVYDSSVPFPVASVPNKCLRLSNGEDAVSFPIALEIPEQSTGQRRQEFSIAFWVRDPADDVAYSDTNRPVYRLVYDGNVPGAEDRFTFQLIPRADGKYGFNYRNAAAQTTLVPTGGSSGLTNAHFFFPDGGRRWNLFVVHRESGSWNTSWDEYDSEPYLYLSINNRRTMTLARNGYHRRMGLKALRDDPLTETLYLQARGNASFTDIRDLSVYDNGGLTEEQVNTMYNQGKPVDPRVLGFSPKHYFTFHDTLADEITDGTFSLETGTLRFEP
jgi:hypothetical protein